MAAATTLETGIKNKMAPTRSTEEVNDPSDKPESDLDEAVPKRLRERGCGNGELCNLGNPSSRDRERRPNQIVQVVKQKLIQTHEHQPSTKERGTTFGKPGQSVTS